MTPIQLEPVAIGTARANVQPAKKTRATTTRGQYVTSAELMEGFYESREKGELTNNMAKYLTLVAEKYSYHPWFSGYSFREDMVAFAVLNLVANWHKFDPDMQEVPNPFAYYTTSVYRSFRAFLNMEHKQREIRDILLIDAGAAPSFNYQSGKTSDDTAFFGGHEE